MAFLFVIIIHSINYILFVIFYYFPHCSSQHMSCWKWCDNQPLPFSCKTDQHSSINKNNNCVLRCLPLRGTLWLYFNCTTLSNELSTSSNVNRSKSSLRINCNYVRFFSCSTINSMTYYMLSMDWYQSYINICPIL